MYPIFYTVDKHVRYFFDSETRYANPYPTCTTKTQDFKINQCKLHYKSDGKLASGDTLYPNLGKLRFSASDLPRKPKLIQIPLQLTKPPYYFTPANPLKLRRLPPKTPQRRSLQAKFT